MLKESDFEKLWFLYQTEGYPANLSIQEFCSAKNVPYEEYQKWERARKKKIVSVEVDGMPGGDNGDTPPDNEAGGLRKAGHQSLQGVHVRLTLPGGITMSKRCRGYDDLLSTVKKLKSLC